MTDRTRRTAAPDPREPPDLARGVDLGRCHRAPRCRARRPRSDVGPSCSPAPTGSSSPARARPTTSPRSRRPSLRETTGAVGDRGAAVGAHPPPGGASSAPGIAGPASRSSIISRSGSTSEAVSVAEAVRAAGHPTIAVTCRRGQPAGRRAPTSRLVSPAGRRGGDRDDPLVREHARPPPPGRRRDGRRRPRPWPTTSTGCPSAGPRRSRPPTSATGSGRSTASGSSSSAAGRPVGIAAEWGLKLTETSQVADRRLRAARVPPWPDLGLRAGRPGRRARRRCRRRARRRGSSREAGGPRTPTTWLIGREADEDRGARRLDLASLAAGSTRRRGSRCCSTRPTPSRSPWPSLVAAIPTRRATSARWSSSSAERDRPTPSGRDDSGPDRPACGCRLTRSDGRGSRSIDAHNHLGPASAGRGPSAPSDELLATLDEAGVETLVDLDGGRATGSRAEIDRWQTRATRTGSSSSPGSTTPAWATRPGVRGDRGRRLRDSAARGARGLKVWKTLGLRARDPHGRLVAIDDAAARPALGDGRRARPPGRHPHRRPDRVLRAARCHQRALGGAARTRTGTSGRPGRRAGPTPPASRRSTSCSRRSIGSSGGIRRRRSSEPMSAAPPRISGWSRACSTPTRTSCRHRRPAGRARAASRTRPARSSCATPTGSCSGPSRRRTPTIYRLHYRFLETFDESFDYGTEPTPGQGRWQIHGLGLPDDVLRAVYRDNALRVLRLDRGRGRTVEPPA